MSIKGFEGIGFIIVPGDDETVAEPCMESSISKSRVELLYQCMDCYRISVAREIPGTIDLSNGLDELLRMLAASGYAIIYSECYSGSATMSAYIPKEIGSKQHKKLNEYLNCCTASVRVIEYVSLENEKIKIEKEPLLVESSTLKISEFIRLLPRPKRYIKGIKPPKSNAKKYYRTKKSVIIMMIDFFDIYNELLIIAIILILNKLSQYLSNSPFFNS